MSSKLFLDASHIFSGAARLAATSFSASLDKCPAPALAISKVVVAARPGAVKEENKQEPVLDTVKESEVLSSQKVGAETTVGAPPPSPAPPRKASTIDSAWLASEVRKSPPTSTMSPTASSQITAPTSTPLAASKPRTTSPPLPPPSLPPIHTLSHPVWAPTPPSTASEVPPSPGPVFESTSPVELPSEPVPELEPAVAIVDAPRPMKSSKVPSSRLGRLFHYGSLAAGLSYGAATEALRRAGSSGEGDQSSLLMSEANVRRMVDKLSRMRGAALKLGQFMSIQDSKLLPTQVEQILMEVQNNANYMPDWQTEKVLISNLGPSWRDHFSSFEMTPFASASIGQVHRATLSPSSPLASSYPPNLPLAIKIQFPGVRTSIASDLSNLKWILIASSVLPRGLYLENTIRVLQRELEEECDYEREAECGVRMKELLERTGGADTHGGFKAPVVVKELCGPMVLTTEFLEGVSLKKATGMTQEQKDEIGERVLKLCLRELFHFKFMQTDPNWSNFLYNKDTKQIELIDFGATRGYTQEFIDKFFGLLIAAVEDDKEACLKYSLALGYLTGEENQVCPIPLTHLPTLLD
ncbi:hypothetical protein MNV49_002107 [Pseudohyphozyma bogoriensis]|nr:hypothetical protein MNV49_002107 [Pseudohyphozyma bogoriensis]